ncbi:MAG: ABC transporter substrate-binding protein [Desulfatiglans sp.]|jgi:molybdate transport system substrate-binding protein|nr:ABC transporter substrate-binding protein [Desulfatiglans sp.]
MKENNQKESCISRRAFIAGSAVAAISTAIPVPLRAEKRFRSDTLQVWSCGGLAEAFIPANKRFREETGVEIAYTGAFAAALGKSLLGSATTEVFAGRVLDLSKKLRGSDKMLFFKPLCFTSYVLVTPKGNPANITDIHDMIKPGVRVILSPDASPPGGDAVNVLLKKAGILDAAMKNCIIKSSCVQRAMQELIEGKGDVSIVERRLTRMALFRDKAEIIPIPEEFFPPPPLTFTIGMMKDAKEPELAEYYIEFIRSEEGQGYFEAAGFIPAISEDGMRLIEKLGVKDV